MNVFRVISNLTSRLDSYLIFHPGAGLNELKTVRSVCVCLIFELLLAANGLYTMEGFIS